MKTGKYIPLGTYNEIKIGYGTVDYKNLKTIYLKLTSWVQPDTNNTDYDLIISRTRRDIKRLISDLNDIKFKPQSIVDLDIRTKGIKTEKRSFMNLEITLYVNDFFDVRSKHSKDNMKKIILLIVNNCLQNKNLYNFYKSKK